MRKAYRCVLALLWWTLLCAFGFWLCTGISGRVDRVGAVMPPPPPPSQQSDPSRTPKRFTPHHTTSYPNQNSYFDRTQIKEDEEDREYWFRHISKGARRRIALHSFVRFPL